MARVGAKGYLLLVILAMLLQGCVSGEQGDSSTTSPLTGTAQANSVQARFGSASLSYQLNLDDEWRRALAVVQLMSYTCRIDQEGDTQECLIATTTPDKPRIDLYGLADGRHRVTLWALDSEGRTMAFNERYLDSSAGTEVDIPLYPVKSFYLELAVAIDSSNTSGLVEDRIYGWRLSSQPSTYQGEMEITAEQDGLQMLIRGIFPVTDLSQLTLTLDTEYQQTVTLSGGTPAQWKLGTATPSLDLCNSSNSCKPSVSAETENAFVPLPADGGRCNRFQVISSESALLWEGMALSLHSALIEQQSLEVQIDGELHQSIGIDSSGSVTDIGLNGALRNGSEVALCLAAPPQSRTQLRMHGVSVSNQSSEPVPIYNGIQEVAEDSPLLFPYIEERG